MLDRLVNKLFSRKFFVFILATIFYIAFHNEVSFESWLKVAIIWIASETTLDLTSLIKGSRE